MQTPLTAMQPDRQRASRQNFESAKAGKRVTCAPQVDPRGPSGCVRTHLQSCASHEHVACVGEDMIQLSAPCIRCCSACSPFTKSPPSLLPRCFLLIILEGSLSHHATLHGAVFHVLLRDRTGLFCFFQRNSPFTHELLCLRSCHRWYHFSIVFLASWQCLVDSLILSLSLISPPLVHGCMVRIEFRISSLKPVAVNVIVLSLFQPYHITSNPHTRTAVLSLAMQGWLLLSLCSA